MIDSLLAWGQAYPYLCMFVAAFLAATLLTLASELILVPLLAAGADPVALVLVATTGNALGACVNYGLGGLIDRPRVQRVLRVTPSRIAAARQRFQRWGSAALLLAWVPVIGDPLTIMAGALRVPFALFLLLVSVGKALRYVVVAGLALAAAGAV